MSQAYRMPDVLQIQHLELCASTGIPLVSNMKLLTVDRYLDGLQFYGAAVIIDFDTEVLSERHQSKTVLGIKAALRRDRDKVGAFYILADKVPTYLLTVAPITDTLQLLDLPT